MTQWTHPTTGKKKAVKGGQYALVTVHNISFCLDTIYGRKVGEITEAVDILHSSCSSKINPL